MVQSFFGYHDYDALPYKPGDIVEIPAGVVVRSTHPHHREKVTKRRQTVRIHHLLPGQSRPCYWLNSRERAYYRGGEDAFALLALVDEMIDQDPPQNVLRKLYELRQNIRVHQHHPSVVWAGAGGYWCEVEINEIIGAPNKVEVSLDPLLAILTEATPENSDAV